MKKKVSFRNLLAMMMVAMLCVGISSCKKEEFYNTSVNLPDIVGFWKFTSGNLEGESIEFANYYTYNSPRTFFYGGSFTLSGNQLTLRSNRGDKYTAKIAFDGMKKNMQMQGKSDDGKTFSYTLKKSY